MKALKRMSSAFGYSEIEPETDLVEPFAETEDEYVNEDESLDYYDDAIIEDREPNPDLARIVTATPTKYTVYREGTPVIVNLTQINPKEARRIVDFISGLVYGLNGAVERVSEAVFLLTPDSIAIENSNGDSAGSRFVPFNQS